MKMNVQTQEDRLREGRQLAMQAMDAEDGNRTQEPLAYEV